MKLVKSTLAALIASAAFAGASYAADQIHIAGSSTVLPYAKIVAEQFAVAVAARHICHHGRRKRRGLMNGLAALLDDAFVGQRAQNALQLGAIGVLQAEFARDLAGADLSGMRANERDDGIPVRKFIVARFAQI